MGLEPTTAAMARRYSSQLSYICKDMERGTGFEPAHPRVEALVHSLFYVTPAWVNALAHCIKTRMSVKTGCTQLANRSGCGTLGT